MIKVYNDMIVVPRSDPNFINLKICLERTIPERTVFSKRGKITIPASTERAFMLDRANMYIPVGLLSYLEPFIGKYEDYRKSSHLYNTDEAISNINKYIDILPGITLRPEQLIACKKILYNHRCICQLTTGCFTGDTRVPLLDGTSPRFYDLINNYKDKYVYCCKEDGSLEFSRIKSVHITKYVSEVVEVEFDDGTSVRCTKEHLFMLRNGKYCEAINLSIGDSLMPYNVKIHNGNKIFINNKIGSNGKSGGKIVIYRYVYKNIIGRRIKGYDIHHINHNHFDDNPHNLIQLSKKEHLREHGSGDSSIQRMRSIKCWDDNYDHMKEVSTNSIVKYNKSDKGRQESRNRAEHMRNLQCKYKNENPYMYHIKRQIASIKSNCRRYHNNYPANCQKCKDKFNKTICLAKSIDPNFEEWNHRVKSIRILSLDNKIPVYDLETESNIHNFAIQTRFDSEEYEFEGSGVFVHNSGKTEIMCATVKILQDINNGIIPTTLIMEPTTRLVEDTIKRFKKYGIEVTKYNDNRRIIENCVNICHPKSLGNDLEKDSGHLEQIQVLFGDECHHYKSKSWRNPTYRTPNLAYSVGVSASAIDQSRVNNNDIRRFEINELLTIGATGPLVLNVTADTMISAGNLAKPVLLVVDNPADEPMREVDIANWHKVMDVKLKSPNRIDLVARSAKEFADRNMKTLILVTTIEWSRMILDRLNYLGLEAIASYGGGRFEKVKSIIDDETQYESLDSNTMDRFASGEYKVLVGTTHLYEGVDIPNLDAIILGYGGRAERMQIQGLGRVLRKTKSGNMAYIVDFTDSKDVVLRKHSNLRMQRYHEIIGIPNDRTYYNIDVEDFGSIINKYEK